MSCVVRTMRLKPTAKNTVGGRISQNSLMTNASRRDLRIRGSFFRARFDRSQRRDQSPILVRRVPPVAKLSPSFTRTARLHRVPIIEYELNGFDRRLRFIIVRMKRLFWILVDLVVWVICSEKALAWGQEGHAAVAA